MKTIALVPAAGVGRRLGDGCSKAYRSIGQRSMLSYTLRAMEECSEIDRIVVIVSPKEVELCEREIIPACNSSKFCRLVTGGTERQQSVYKGLLAIQEEAGVVVIHDAARPFVSWQLLQQSILEAKKSGACTAGIPVRDTLKKINEDGVIEETVSRSRLWIAQTPQSFWFSLLLRAHQQALKEDFQGTDDAGLVERLGFPVKMIPGSSWNIKITYPEDLELARKLVSSARAGKND